MNSVLSITDNSIDIVGAFLFASAIFWALHYLWENHLSVQARIILGFVISLSILHVFQVIFQVWTNGIAPFRVWDIINYTTAVLFLMLTHRIARKESII